MEYVHFLTLQSVVEMEYFKTMTGDEKKNNTQSVLV